MPKMNCKTIVVLSAFVLMLMVLASADLHACGNDCKCGCSKCTGTETCSEPFNSVCTCGGIPCTCTTAHPCDLQPCGGKEDKDCSCGPGCICASTNLCKAQQNQACGGSVVCVCGGPECNTCPQHCSLATSPMVTEPCGGTHDCLASGCTGDKCACGTFCKNADPPCGGTLDCYDDHCGGWDCDCPDYCALQLPDCTGPVTCDCESDLGTCLCEDSCSGEPLCSTSSEECTCADGGDCPCVPCPLFPDMSCAGSKECDCTGSTGCGCDKYCENGSRPCADPPQLKHCDCTSEIPGKKGEECNCSDYCPSHGTAGCQQNGHHGAINQQCTCPGDVTCPKGATEACKPKKFCSLGSGSESYEPCKGVRTCDDSGCGGVTTNCQCTDQVCMNSSIQLCSQGYYYCYWDGCFGVNCDCGWLCAGSPGCGESKSCSEGICNGPQCNCTDKYCPHAGLEMPCHGTYNCGRDRCRGTGCTCGDFCKNITPTCGGQPQICPPICHGGPHCSCAPWCVHGGQRPCQTICGGDPEYPAIMLNRDHDNGNSTVEDRNDSGPIAAENDLHPIPIYWNSELKGTLTLEWTSNRSKIGSKVWTTASKADHIDLTDQTDPNYSITWDLSDLEHNSPPGALYIEGIEKSDSHGDVGWRLTQKANGSTVFADDYYATIYDVYITAPTDKLWVNNDNDDHEQEDDLKSFTLNVEPTPPQGMGQLKLDAVSFGDCVDVWTTDHMAAEETLPYTADAIPKSLWLEGISHCAQEGDVKLEPAFTEGGYTASGIDKPFTVYELSDDHQSPIMTGGVGEDDGIHSDCMTVTATPKITTGVVTFELEGSSGENVDAVLASTSVPFDEQGRAVNCIRSSDAADTTPTVKMKCEGNVKSVQYAQIVPGTGLSFWPECIPADGVSQADIEYDATWPGSAVGIPDHHIAFKIVGVVDIDNNPVTDTAEWPNYGSVYPTWNDYVVTNQFGVALGGVFTAGTMPGYVEIAAEDGNVWTN